MDNEEVVKCPMHGNDLPLVKRGDKLVAICNCYTGGVKNRWKGKVVVERKLPKRRANRKSATKKKGE